MDGMAKSPEQPEIQVPVKKTDAVSSSAAPKDTSPATIHSEVYKYFNVVPGDDQHNAKEIAVINAWAMEDSSNWAHGIQKISDLEYKLGSPRINESTMTKMYNFIRMGGLARDKQASLNSALKDIKSSYAARLDNIKQSKDDKVTQLTAEIDRLEKDFEKTQRLYTSTASEKISQIKSTYVEQIKELKIVRDAYKSKGGK